LHAATKQLLAAEPELIKVLDNDLNTAFTEAVSGAGHSEEELLALGMTPEEVEEVDIYGYGSIIRGKCCHEIVTLLYNLYPEAATLEVDISRSPFLCAVVYKNEFAMELLQWKLSFDDIVAACTHELARDDPPNYIERYQPIMETQCEALFALLGDDVMGIVFECLGLEARKSKKERYKQTPTCVKKAKHSDQGTSQNKTKTNSSPLVFSRRRKPFHHNQFYRNQPGTCPRVTISVGGSTNLFIYFLI